MSESVAAVVVTFNRKQFLKECLEGILKQSRPVQGIVLIDNASTDGTPKMLKDLGFLECIMADNQEQEISRTLQRRTKGGSDVELHYVRMLTNVGSSGGFNEGVKRGYRVGYDRLWIMDDDCLPDERCLQALLENLSENEIGGPLKFVTGTTRFDYVQSRSSDLTSARIEVPAEAFNGLLVSRRVVSGIGYPNRKFFIMRDDTEYCFRARERGFRCYRVNAARLHHPESPHFEIMILWLKIVIPFYAKGDRIYYRVRNLTYLHRLYKSNYRFRTLLKAYGYEIIALLLKEFSFRRVWLLTKGLMAGIFTSPTMTA